MMNPPTLANLDLFQEWATSHKLRIVRAYVPIFEDEETGDLSGGFWVTILSIEGRAPDDTVHIWNLQVSDHFIEQGREEVWDVQAELLAAAWERHLEGHGWIPDDMEPV